MWKLIQKRLQSADSYVSMILGLAVVIVIGMLVIKYVNTKTQEQVKEQEKNALQNVTLPATYSVAPGDTLWTIAEHFYKSGYNWVDIVKENALTNPDYIEVGQVLTIPDVAPIVLEQGQIAAAATTLEKHTYTVVRGDTLWDIAVKEYSDGYKWSTIAQANSLTNPDLIFSGNVLVLP